MVGIDRVQPIVLTFGGVLWMTSFALNLYHNYLNHFCKPNCNLSFQPFRSFGSPLLPAFCTSPLSLLNWLNSVALKMMNISIGLTPK